MVSHPDVNGGEAFESDCSTFDADAMEYTALDTAADFVDGVGFTIFEKSGIGNVLAGLANDDPGQIAAGYGQQLMWAAPGAAASTHTAATRVFWSGGDVAADAAAAYAHSIGGTTLEMTLTGKALTWATNRFGSETVAPLWNVASRTFARGASGEVAAVHNTHADPRCFDHF